MKSENAIKYLKSISDKDRAEHLQRYFKTRKGEYGYKDKFLGITVPVLRKQAKIYRGMPLSEILRLLRNEFHEVRLFSLLLLVDLFATSNEIMKEKISNLYLKNTRYINNWDLVDLSSRYILGQWLFDKNRSILYKLAGSKSLWERRISVISTFYFISKKDFNDSLKIAHLLLYDKEDLIHKAVGWMLREIGNRDIKTEEVFLKKHYKKMPRTMLRYAIEKFPEARRKAYLMGKM